MILHLFDKETSNASVEEPDCKTKNSKHLLIYILMTAIYIEIFFLRLLTNLSIKK